MCQLFKNRILLFFSKLKKDDYVDKYKKLEKVMIKTKRNGEKIINRLNSIF